MMTTTVAEALARPFASIDELIKTHAAARPEHPALIVGDQRISYAQLEALSSQVAASLQRDGSQSGDRVATIGNAGVEHLLVLIGCLRAGMVIAPLPGLAHPDQLARMLNDLKPTHLFVDPPHPTTNTTARLIELNPDGVAAWLIPSGAPAPVAIEPQMACNIIYSSGTTGAPKGVVQPHQLRWGQIQRGMGNGFDQSAVMLLATPLCSNTTLTGLFSVLGTGGAAVFLGRFDAESFLASAVEHSVTHTTLVPIQYQRILDHPRFDHYDLSHFRIKISTGAPLSVPLKRQILQRWPGALHEYYGLTEGGVFTLLDASLHQDKLHTVGKPPAGFDVRIIDENGAFLPPGVIGDIVGHSHLMMTEYFGQPEKTVEIEWFSPDGTRYLRSGDLGRFDDDGFLEIVGRRKEMIVSGGFNIYPRDIEEIVVQHPDVREAAVVGVPSEHWGETPVAWIVLKHTSAVSADHLKEWVNERLGKTQRLSAVCLLDSLPRNAMDKVIKAELRGKWLAGENCLTGLSH